jgi:energy-coupling factor transporter ATP-binding protein EcfA2
MIRLRDVSVELPAGSPHAKTIIKSATLEIRDGEWVALLGANGSGKTTLLHAIARLAPTASGKIDYSNEAEGSGHSDATPRISLLLQEPDNQFITTSVRHELELSALVGSPQDTASRRIEEAIENFSLTALLGRNPHRLSGGEKQRLALATVWLQAPEILLLDEPTAYLDDEAAALCREFVNEAHRSGTTVVWATTGGEDLLHADLIACIDNGRLLFDGAIDELYSWASANEYDFIWPTVRALAERLAGAMVTPADLEQFLETTGSSAAALADKLAPLIPAAGAAQNTRASRNAPLTETVSDHDPVVRLESVGFAFDTTLAVQGIDLTVGRGECVGLAGHNGAGKSTVLGLSAGVHQPITGKLLRKFRRTAEGDRQNVFYLFQSPERLFFAETVSEELSFGMRRLGLSPGECERRCRSALEAVGLEARLFLPRAPLTLSPGEMRRVAFAIALSLEPEFLLLDEPTSCLDPGGRAAVESIVQDRRKRGETTMIASHDASFLAGVCDRIAWLRDGRIETTMEISDGTLAPGTVWPEKPLPILEVQDRLAELGVTILPRELTVNGLIERLVGNRGFI